MTRFGGCFLFLSLCPSFLLVDVCVSLVSRKEGVASVNLSPSPPFDLLLGRSKMCCNRALLAAILFLSLTSSSDISMTNGGEASESGEEARARRVGLVVGPILCNGGKGGNGGKNLGTYDGIGTMVGAFCGRGGGLGLAAVGLGGC